MSRNHRRRYEDEVASHWEPAYARSHRDEYRWRHYAPSNGSAQARSFNYWRDEAVPSNSGYPARPYSWDDQWNNANGSWGYETSSYSTRRHDFGRGRNWESWRDRSPPRERPSRHRRFETHTPDPYSARHAFHEKSPVESIPHPPKPIVPDPPRKKSPINPPSQPPQPSPGYLSLSEESSEILNDPGSVRKLLVLDLNGTLLIRSPRSRASSGSQLRPVQPRPYMQSFRQYLFCAETKAWLDTMVWSSAQPHSVDDMVNKVFGATKGELKAVWNRKSLGLSEAEYHRKTVTTKDLAKPWSLLDSALHPEKDKGHAVSLPSPVSHSALTTLLLDDSLHKAALQPYNHVCIPEYDSARRQHDLKFFLATRVHKDGKRSKKAKQKNEVDTVPQSTDQVQISPEDTPSETASQEPYDVILLAVIGILEAVKVQSNVAAWIHQGGVWAARERLGDAALNTIVGTGNDASSSPDPTATSEAHSPTKLWFDDPSVVAYWVSHGRRALTELGIQVIHGMTG